MRRAIMLDRIAMKSAALSMPSAKTASDLPKCPERSFMVMSPAFTQKPTWMTRDALPNVRFDP